MLNKLKEECIKSIEGLEFISQMIFAIQGSKRQGQCRWRCYQCYVSHNVTATRKELGESVGGGVKEISAAGDGRCSCGERIGARCATGCHEAQRVQSQSPLRRWPIAATKGVRVAGIPLCPRWHHKTI